MAKISYADHVKKSDISVILAEIVFQHLKSEYKTVKLSEVVDTSSGGTPSRTNPQYYGGEIPWLKSGELNDSIITSSEEFISEEGLKNSSAKIFPKGSLLVAMYGATAGKTGILGIDASTNQAVCSVTPKDTSISTDFLFWFFRAHRFHFIDISRGGAQPNISQGVINKTLFPIVPKDTQEEIVTFLSNAEKTKFIDYSLIPNELHHDIKSAFNYLHCLESLVTENKSQQTYLTQLRQAILQEAIEGKLTADWRVKNPVQKGSTDFDALALLEKIKAEKQKLIAEGKLKKEKPLAPINADDVPFALPDGWVWVRLLEVSLISGGMQKTPFRTPTKNFYPYLGVQNVQRGYLNLNEIKYFEATEAELKRLMLVKNDLLIIEGNGSINEIGRCAIWNEEIENCIHQNHIMRCRPFINSQSKFFITVLNSKFGIEQMQEKARTTTGLFNLSVGKLSSVIMPLPPLAEQHAIVARVDRLLASVNALEQQVKERKTYAEQLMQAVLKEAFAG